MTRLDQEPKAQPRTVEEVMSLAAAMERKTAERYTHLAAEMRGRGDHGVAATFEAMVEEERDHLAAIERWSQKATQQPSGTASDTWELPAEFARSWDEVRESAVLTPYQALGMAVINEERGFAFYSYIAAAASAAAPIGASGRRVRQKRCTPRRSRSISWSALTRWSGARPSSTERSPSA